MIDRIVVAMFALTLCACASAGRPTAATLLPLREADRSSGSLGQTKGFELLFAFQNANQGMSPYAGVFVDATGNIIGTTEYGGADSCGTLFELAPAGGFYAETILHSFSRAVDGCEVYGTPVRDLVTQDIYVTTPYGGAAQSGTVVDLSPGSGGYQETAVYSFESETGYQPEGRVVQVGSTIYALASRGGRNDAGAIIQLSELGLRGSEVYAFLGLFGSSPEGGLVADAKGSVYGTTSGGGPNKQGSVFKFTPDKTGGKEFVLWSFGGHMGDGAYPVSDALLLDKEGNIYGTTVAGGTHNLGTVFKLEPNGGGYTYTETILHSFGSSFDGAAPWGGLVLVGDDLWGTTTKGGGKPCACGTIFSLSTNGAHYRVKLSFQGARDGAAPYGSLFWDGRALYGTSNSGGSPFNGGTVFRYIP